MTRGEASDILSDEEISCLIGKFHGAKEALDLALTALRPVTKEQVEKVWRGEWKQDKNGQVVCSRCGAITAIGSKAALHNANEYDRFCFSCGAPMTDEAVQMVMKRLEEIYK